MNAILEGRRALVTGAARRLGRTIAVELARAGAGCVLHYRASRDDVEKTAALCRDAGVDTEVIAADLGDPEAVERVAARADELGVDVLVHNASVFARLPFLEGSFSEHRAALDRDFAIHVRAPYLLGRKLGATFVRRGWGRIVILGDWSSEGQVFRNYGSYLVSKGAVPTLTRVLALELGSACPAVTVNAILPGPLVPPETDPVAEDWIRRQTLGGRWLGTDAVARAVVFLIATAEITGETLRIDGGRTLIRD